MGLDERALPLIESIYASAIEPGGWKRLAEDLSDAFGRAGVAISMPHPDSELPLDVTRFRLRDDLESVFVRHLMGNGLPWGNPGAVKMKDRFGFPNESISPAEIEQSEFYREYMQPNDLAPECPIYHEISTGQIGKLVGIVIYRRAGSRPFDESDLTLGNLLVPHLERGYAIYSRLGNVRRARIALAEILDRLPTGVLVFDAQNTPVIVNRSARRAT